MKIFPVWVHPNPKNLISIRLYIDFQKQHKDFLRGLEGVWTQAKQALYGLLAGEVSTQRENLGLCGTAGLDSLVHCTANFRSPDGVNLAQKSAHIFAWIDPFMFNRGLCSDDAVLHIAHTKLQYGTGSLAF